MKTQPQRLRRVPKGKRIEGADMLHAVSPELAKPLEKALNAIKANDLVSALQHFADCANIDPTNKAVLYFGGDAVSRAFLQLRYTDPPADPAKVAEWRRCAYTLAQAMAEASPGDAVALHNVGRLLHDDGFTDEAMDWYKRALALDRGQLESWANMGTCLYDKGDVQGAELCWSKAVAVEANSPGATLAQSYIWLRRGDYLRGWKAMNARWVDPAFAANYGRPDLGGRMWTGQPLGKKDTIFLHGEQGLGDHVQFARYIPELIARKIRVVGIETRAPLKRWFEASLPDVPVYVRDKDRLPNFSHHAPLMSLPGLLGMEEVPKPLAPFGTVIRSPFKREVRVGLIFKGTTGNPIDAQRSIPDEMLGALADIPGVTWVPLQYDPSGTMDLTARAWLGKSVEPTPKFKDVYELAEVMASLDMVVAVDTLGAHVAGSIGVPTLLLHRFNREWRWQNHFETTDWYPSVRMITQGQPGGWADVLHRVREHLTSGALGNSAVTGAGTSDTASRRGS